MRDFISKLFFVFVNSFSFKWLYSRKSRNSPLRVSLSCSESALLYDTDHTLRLLNCWERAEREANTRFSCVEELRGAILFLLRRGGRGRTLSAGVVWPLHYRVRLSPALSSHLLLRQPSQWDSETAKQSGWPGPGAPPAVREEVPRLAVEVSKNRVIAFFQWICPLS